MHIHGFIQVGIEVKVEICLSMDSRLQPSPKYMDMKSKLVQWASWSQVSRSSQHPSGLPISRLLSTNSLGNNTHALHWEELVEIPATLPVGYFQTTQNLNLSSVLVSLPVMRWVAALCHSTQELGSGTWKQRVFGCWLQLVCYAYLLSQSRYFICMWEVRNPEQISGRWDRAEGARGWVRGTGY